MVTVVGVHFRNAGKIYYFDPKDLPVKMMDRVIVDTVRGLEIGTCMTDKREINEEAIQLPLREVIRFATEDDEERERRNKEKEEDAFIRCKKKIAEHELDMKLVGAEYSFDNSKLLFYFTSDGRVDFRALVKDLASEFRTRIELRQIGVRDETKIMGGIGICGREVCCKSYLADFAPVSIKMAKTQNLSLNPTKISGICGRLMCCLKNEEETYEYLNSNMPRLGDEVRTEDGIVGEVSNLSILKQKVKVVYENNGIREAKEFPVSEITVLSHRKKNKGNQAPETEELKETLDADEEKVLEELEREEEMTAPAQDEASEGREQSQKPYNRDRRNNKNNRRDNRNNKKQAEEANTSNDTENQAEKSANRDNRQGGKNNYKKKKNYHGNKGNRKDRQPSEGQS